MSGKSKKLPYYAKWWFFFFIIGLGWITPITKHWKKYVFWEQADAYPIRQYNKYGIQVWKYVYQYNDQVYFTSYDGGRTSFVEVNSDAIELVAQTPSFQSMSSDKREELLSSMKKTKKVLRAAPIEFLSIHYNPDNPGESFYFDFDWMYDNEHLFFPVALQIFMIAFFIGVRYK